MFHLRLSLLSPRALNVAGMEPARKVLYARTNTGFEDVLKSHNSTDHEIQKWNSCKQATGKLLSDIAQQFSPLPI